jgi:chromosome segregation ATPase
MDISEVRQRLGSIPTLDRADGGAARTEAQITRQELENASLADELAQAQQRLADALAASEKGARCATEDTAVHALEGKLERGELRLAGLARRLATERETAASGEVTALRDIGNTLAALSTHCRPLQLRAVQELVAVHGVIFELYARRQGVDAQLHARAADGADAMTALFSFTDVQLPAWPGEGVRSCGWVRYPSPTIPTLPPEEGQQAGAAPL